MTMFGQNVVIGVLCSKSYANRTIRAVRSNLTMGPVWTPKSDPNVGMLSHRGYITFGIMVTPY